MQAGEFIRLDPNDQDPISVTGGECSQMSVPRAKQPFLFDLPTFVKVKGGEYLFVPGLKKLEASSSTFVPNSKPAVGLSLKFAALVFLPSTRRTQCPDSAARIRADGRSELFRIA
jgi:hypothetical protein